MASSIWRGFCELAAESRKDSGLPWNVSSKIGKSARTLWASSFGFAVTAIPFRLHPRYEPLVGENQAADGEAGAADDGDDVPRPRDGELEEVARPAAGEHEPVQREERDAEP